MKTCEVTFSSGIGKRCASRQCGKPAVFVWTPRSRPDRPMLMCAEHGPEIAGNFKDELKPI